jgi:SAM-dependent methyltransferase
MTKLVELACVKKGERILDLGSGSGSTSEILLQNRQEVSVVLLDGSPQMVRLAREQFNHMRGVRVALCRLPPHGGEDIDLGREKFSLITIHQSLRDLIDAFGNVDNLARWCRDRLDNTGRVMIGAHNGIVLTKEPDGFSGWEDPFRAALIKKLSENRQCRPYLRKSPKKLSEKEIQEAFERQGFEVLTKHEEVFQYSFEDRQRMWHVPAVMDSVIDVRRVGSEVVAKFVDEAVGPLLRQQTMPRTMIYWLFKMKPRETARDRLFPTDASSLASHEGVDRG